MAKIKMNRNFSLVFPLYYSSFVNALPLASHFTMFHFCGIFLVLSQELSTLVDQSLVMMLSHIESMIQAAPPPEGSNAMWE